MKQINSKLFIFQLLKNEETRQKTISIFISILMAITLVIFAIGSIPSVMLGAVFDQRQEDILIFSIYQDTIIVVDKLNLDWIEDQKNKYSYCDEFEIDYNYSLTYQDLISIDSVLLRQDFNNIKSKDVENLALKFIVKETYVTEREEIEEYEETIIDQNGNEKTVTKTRKIIIKTAHIIINTKTFEEVLPEVGIVSEEDIALARNIYETISNMDLEGNLNIYDDIIDIDDLEEYPEGYADLPYYNQTDKRWANHPYGSSTIYSSGCGPTSLAMVVSGLTGNRITPDVVANWSVQNGHRAEGAGSYWSLMTAGGKYYGLNVESVSRKNPNKTMKALSDGHPVIVSMGKGHFTNGGHFIVLVGLTSDGKVLVHDPASVKRSNQAWDISIIMNESSKNGGANGSPFWIFRR